MTSNRRMPNWVGQRGGGGAREEGMLKTGRGSAGQRRGQAGVKQGRQRLRRGAQIGGPRARAAGRCSGRHTGPAKGRPRAAMTSGQQDACPEGGSGPRGARSPRRHRTPLTRGQRRAARGTCGWACPEKRATGRSMRAPRPATASGWGAAAVDGHAVNAVSASRLCSQCSLAAAVQEHPQTERAPPSAVTPRSVAECA
jgi:hypothetical protein